MIPGNRPGGLTSLRRTAVGLLAAALLAAGAPRGRGPRTGRTRFPAHARFPGRPEGRPGRGSPVHAAHRSRTGPRGGPAGARDLGPTPGPLSGGPRRVAPPCDRRPRRVRGEGSGRRLDRRAPGGDADQAGVDRGGGGSGKSVRRHRWWCDALLGLSLHVAGRIPEAERAFDAALAAMPREIRCAWGEELTHVLSGSLQREYAERAATRERCWSGDSGGSPTRSTPSPGTTVGRSTSCASSA
jgi:hypothetical protein